MTPFFLSLFFFLPLNFTLFVLLSCSSLDDVTYRERSPTLFVLVQPRKLTVSTRRPLSSDVTLTVGSSTAVQLCSRVVLILLLPD